MNKIYNPKVHNRYNCDISTEVWKPIIYKGIDTMYEISSFGNVRNRFGKYISPGKLTAGYLQVYLHWFDSEGNKYDVRFMVHRLVGIAFVPNPDPEKKTEINHINFDTSCNYDWNLEWVTRKENMEWSKSHGRMKGLRDFEHPNFKPTKRQVLMMYTMLKDGVLTDTEIAEKTGLALSFVNSVALGKTCIELSRLYGYTPREAKRSVERGFYEKHYEHLDKLILAGASTNDIMKLYPLDCSKEGYRTAINTRRQVLIQEGKMTNVYDKHNVNLRVHLRKGPWDHKGEKSPVHKYSEDQIRRACELLQENKLTCTKIAELTGLTRAVVNDVKDGKRWAHVSKDYDISRTKAGFIPEKYHEELIHDLKEGNKVPAVADVFIYNHPEILDMMNRKKIIEKLHYINKQIKAGVL